MSNKNSLIFFENRERTLEFYDWLCTVLALKDKDLKITKIIPPKFSIYFRKFMEKFSVARLYHKMEYVANKEVTDDFSDVISDYYTVLGECEKGLEVSFLQEPPVNKFMRNDDCKYVIGNSVASWLAFALCEEEAKFIINPSLTGGKCSGYANHAGVKEVKRSAVGEWTDDDIEVLAKLVEAESFQEENSFFVTPDMLKRDFQQHLSFRPLMKEDVTYIDVLGDFAGWPVRSFFGSKNWDKMLFFGNTEDAAKMIVGKDLELTIYDKSYDEEHHHRLLIKEKANFEITSPLSIIRILTK